ncbi:hypothetical protein AVEN_208542-1, partial [Araneus ventricosus]
KWVIPASRSRIIHAPICPLLNAAMDSLANKESAVDEESSAKKSRKGQRAASGSKCCLMSWHLLIFLL